MSVPPLGRESRRLDEPLRIATWRGVPPPIVASPDYDVALPPGHRFPMGKFRALAQILEQERLAPAGFSRPEPADFDLLARAHDPEYVAQVLSQTVPEAVARRIGLPVTADVARRACAAAGGTLLTARLALEHGLACNTAGGSHHAGYAGGAGFCVFNDVAVAALQLLSEGAVRRVLVIDLDVHQGDGTADILAKHPRAFTVSVHCEANYPTRKVRGDMDVGLPVGTGDTDYLQALRTLLPQALRAAKPDLVFYNAGVDVHAEDQLGRLALSDAGLAARDRLVLEHFWGEAPVAGVLGGGYGPDPHVIAERHASLHRRAAEIYA